MHEYGIVRRIISVVSDSAIKANATRVEEISLVVGELSGYIGESMQMYFNLCARDTVCEGAELKIEFIPAKFRCTECGKEFRRDRSLSFSCPLCGKDGEPTATGKEFYIKSSRVIN